MALVVKDRIKVTAAAPGTGNVTLGSAELGYQTFAAIGNNNSTYYAIQDLANNLWEVGEGVFTTSGPTLTRSQVLSNSAGNTSAINFTNAVEVFVTTPATKSVHMNLTDDLEIDGDVTFTSDNATDQVLIKNTNIGASAAPDLVLWRDSASPANADSVGRIDFRGEDDGSTARNYTSIESKIVNVAASTPTGAIHFKTLNASTSEADVLVLSGNAATFAGGVDAATFFRAPNFYTGVGSQGLVNTNTNDLKLVSQSGDTHIYMDNDLAVELYHNNAKKLETTSSGIDVTGGIVADHHVNIGTGMSYQWGDSHERIEQSDGVIEFFTGNNEKMRLQGSTLLVGSTTAIDTTLSGGTPALQVVGSGFSAIQSTTRRDSGAYGPAVILAKSKNATVGSYTAVVDNDSLGSIIFIGDDGTDLDTYGATIGAEVNGTPGSNDMPADLVFSTNGGTSTVTERVRILSTGGVGIGQTSPVSSIEYALHVEGSSVSSGGGLAVICATDTSTAYNGTNPGGGITFRGKYNNSGSITNFGSVQAVKENTADGNYASALRFTTRVNGGNLTEQLRIASSGNATFSGQVIATNKIQGSTVSVDTNGGFYLIQASSKSSIRSESQPIVLQTYASSAWQDRVTVTNNGNVGINTSSPDANNFGAGAGILTVASDTGSAKTAMLNLVGDGNDTDATRVASLFYNDASATGAGATIAGIEAYRASNHATDPGGDLLFRTNIGSTGGYSERMRIRHDGNVGISATDPQFKLHVNKGSGNYAPASGIDENIAGFQTSFNADSPQILTFSQLDGNWVDGTSGGDYSYGWVWGYANNVRGGLVYDVRGSERMQLWSSYGTIAIMTPDAADGNGVPTDSNINERLVIPPGGNVGIGGDPVPTDTGYNNGALHLRGTTTGSQVHFTTPTSGHTATDGGHISYWSDNHFYHSNLENGQFRFYSGGIECLNVSPDSASNADAMVGIGVQGADPNGWRNSLTIGGNTALHGRGSAVYLNYNNGGTIERSILGAWQNYVWLGNLTSNGRVIFAVGTGGNARAEVHEDKFQLNSIPIQFGDGTQQSTAATGSGWEHVATYEGDGTDLYFEVTVARGYYYKIYFWDVMINNSSSKNWNFRFNNYTNGLQKDHNNNYITGHGWAGWHYTGGSDQSSYNGSAERDADNSSGSTGWYSISGMGDTGSGYSSSYGNIEYYQPARLGSSGGTNNPIFKIEFTNNYRREFGIQRLSVDGTSGSSTDATFINKIRVETLQYINSQFYGKFRIMRLKDI